MARQDLQGHARLRRSLGAMRLGKRLADIQKDSHTDMSFPTQSEDMPATKDDIILLFKALEMLKHNDALYQSLHLAGNFDERPAEVGLSKRQFGSMRIGR